MAEQEHKVIRAGGDQDLQSKLDQWSKNGWDTVTVMQAQKGERDEYIAVVRRTVR